MKFITMATMFENQFENQMEVRDQISNLVESINTSDLSDSDKIDAIDDAISRLEQLKKEING